ncbi:olfactory receptor 14K1-like [Sorex fumeus]|uniref:olfactory receptor 14K1-like n=1 Tax=Sorex fumeus TaxID=62283 RepID=UPI0024AD08BF|nr:olfactory receptor 14K1-like [Sorex fumeus]
MGNLTGSTDFCLVQFSASRELQWLHGALFLLIYLGSLLGNLLIVLLVSLDHCLHTPMYFFLKHLSLLDAGLISVTVPRLVASSFSHRSSIPWAGCLLQVLLVIHFAGSELFLLTAMAYDRYVAICHPLHYEIIMGRALCVRFAVASWGLGGLFGSLYAGGTFSLSFCGSRRVPQFFCDVPALLKISCSADHMAISISVAAGVVYALFCFVSVGFSYVSIFNAVMRIPSLQGRSKAFSTCIPHLTVITTFIVTGTAAYLKPVPDSPGLLDLLVSAFYSVLPPSLNPLIYSLRNKEIKAALGRLLWRLSHIRFCEGRL